MIVTFVSECRKKSIQKTQRILDTYAYRIGRRTWQANLTELGLEAIRQRLTDEATRSTAIACHRVISRRQTELVWVVGNKRVFDSRGRVAVHRTRTHQAKKYADGMWQHLPLMQSLIRMAALWHDFGKAAEPFQNSLRQGGSVDALRHEWLSLALFDAFVSGHDDLAWLNDLVAIEAWFNDEQREIDWIGKAIRSSTQCPLRHPIEQPITRWIKWLIVSHHLLPHSPNDAVCEDRAADWNSIVADVDATWGYQKLGRTRRTQKDLDEAFSFPSGLPIRSKPWREAAVETANSLIAERLTNIGSRWDRPSDIERTLLVLARASLMLGDHRYSSEESDKSWRTDYPPFANTRKAGDQAECRPGQTRLKQKLDEHLVRVADRAVRVAGRLPFLQAKMPFLEVPRELRKASPAKYHWQNKAVTEIQALTADRSPDRRDRPGTLIVNTAGTGAEELGRRYAINLANGRFLWRNRVGAEAVEVNVTVLAGADDQTWEFDAMSIPLNRFDVDDPEVDSLGQRIARTLRGETEFLLLQVTAKAKVGSAQEVFPSQEIVQDAPSGKGSKSKFLYSVSNIAAMHSQKVGNAIRTIDTWYADDAEKPIAVESYGAVTTEGKAYRDGDPAPHFYKLFDKWSVGEAVDDEQKHYLIAMLIRGGVFGQSEKEAS